MDIKDYDEYRGGQRVLDDKHLKRLIDVLSLRTLGRAHCGLDTLNIAYDYFLRYSLETARNKAGAFYTPQDVVRLAVKLLEPTPKSTIYDPACGSGEFLKSALHHVEKASSEKGKKLKLYGQESVPTALAMAKTQMFLRSSVKADITAGDALREPHFIEDGKLKRFDRVLTNPPWNQSGYDETFYKRDKWGRFDYGTPPKFSADWGWVQHILASLDDHGRAAVLLDIGAVSRSSGSRSSHKERDIRRALVKLDVIEGAILLPGKLFDKTAAPSLLLLLNRSKPPERKNQILLVDASNYSSQGRAATLRDEDIDAVYEVYKEWETRENFSRGVART